MKRLLCLVFGHTKWQVGGVDFCKRCLRIKDPQDCLDRYEAAIKALTRPASYNELMTRVMKQNLGPSCDNRNHNGMDAVLVGQRLPCPELGQDAAFIAFSLGKLEAIAEKCERDMHEDILDQLDREIFDFAMEMNEGMIVKEPLGDSGPITFKKCAEIIRARIKQALAGRG